MSLLTVINKENKEYYIREIAGQALLGNSYLQIAKSLKIDDKTVKKMLNSNECQDIIKKYGERVLNEALTLLRDRSKKLMPKALAVLEHHLDEKNLQAAIQLFKIFDKEIADKGEVKDTTIQIIMPSSEDKPINITREYDEFDKKNS